MNNALIADTNATADKIHVEIADAELVITKSDYVC